MSGGSLGALRRRLRATPTVQLKLATTIAAATFILAVGLFGRASIRAVVPERQEFKRARVALGALDALRVSILEVETGQRGYILTGDPRYLRPYEQNRAEVSRQLAAVEASLGSVPGQAADLLLLRGHVAAKLAELAATLRIGRERGPREAVVEINTNRGFDAMEGLRAAMGRVSVRVQADYRARDESVARRLHRAEQVVTAGTLGSFALMLSMLAWVWRDVREREDARRLIATQTAALNHTNERLTASEHDLAARLTEQERLSGELAGANAALDRRVHEHHALNAALERSNLELNQFAYVASHDLKAPLRAINNLSEWIEEDLGAQVSSATREQMSMLRGRVRRMDLLIDGILAYSRVSRSTDRPLAVSVRALVLEQIDSLAPPPDTVVHVPATMPDVVCERVAFQQVWMNLLSNAFKHARRVGAVVEVTVADRGDCWEFGVTDNGAGIDPKYHVRVFGLFQTLVSRDRVESTGIGLALVKKIVETRGGSVALDSQAGAGATFRFCWPKEYLSPDALAARPRRPS